MRPPVKLQTPWYSPIYELFKDVVYQSYDVNFRKLYTPLVELLNNKGMLRDIGLGTSATLSLLESFIIFTLLGWNCKRNVLVNLNLHLNHQSIVKYWRVKCVNMMKIVEKVVIADIETSLGKLKFYFFLINNSKRQLPKIFNS